MTMARIICVMSDLVHGTPSWLCESCNIFMSYDEYIYPARRTLLGPECDDLLHKTATRPNGIVINNLSCVRVRFSVQAIAFVLSNDCHFIAYSKPLPCIFTLGILAESSRHSSWHTIRQSCGRDGSANVKRKRGFGHRPFGWMAPECWEEKKPVQPSRFACHIANTPKCVLDSAMLRMLGNISSVGTTIGVVWRRWRTPRRCAFAERSHHITVWNAWNDLCIPTTALADSGWIAAAAVGAGAEYDECKCWYDNISGVPGFLRLRAIGKIVKDCDDFNI